MLPRSALSSRLRHVLSSQQTRNFTSSKALLAAPTNPATSSPQTPSPTSQRWLTKKVKESPTALKIFLKVAHALGYGTQHQVSARRALHLYNDLCALRADDESEFWQNECHLPPTFQSWFTITNLHIFLLTVRLRALPAPHGTHHVQGLIDHFFLDVEDRIRAVLQPGVLPAPTPASQSQGIISYYSSPYPQVSFYPAPPRAPVDDKEALKRERMSRAPERIVTKQMKIFREQWAGMGLALDLGLVQGDAELAAAVWRNLLGARGARGIMYNVPAASSTPSPSYFRRSVNLVGGEVESVAKIDKQGGVEVEEARDDGSGVHDFAPGVEADRYVAYPELMLRIVEYTRRELKRLEGLSDRDIMGARATGGEGEGINALRFGGI